MAKPYRNAKGQYAKRPKFLWVPVVLILAVIYGIVQEIKAHKVGWLIFVIVIAAAFAALVVLRRVMDKKKASAEAEAREKAIVEREAQILAEKAEKKAKVQEIINRQTEREKREAAALFICPACGAQTHGPACEYCGTTVR